jgi:uncharacterized membrane protein YdfJ with MMPL/SSD domain
MREGYERYGTTDGAIAYSLRHTASIVTGAALIMTGVFFAFALSDLSSMRQLGVGLSVAVLLDATLVRLVLLPAVIKLVGPLAWRTSASTSRRKPAPGHPSYTHVDLPVLPTSHAAEPTNATTR